MADNTTALKAIIDANAGIEINRVEYLQFREESGKAEKKVPDTPPEAVVEKAPEPEAAEPVPDTAALYAQARGLIMQLATAGYRNKAVEILGKFGAQKLGQVPAENLADVAMLAEQALGDTG